MHRHKKISVDYLYIWYFESLATQRPSKRLANAMTTPIMETSDRYCEILPRVIEILTDVSEAAIVALARICVHSKAPVQSLESIVAKHSAIKKSLVEKIILELESLSEQHDEAAHASLYAPNAEVLSPRILPSNYSSINMLGWFLVIFFCCTLGLRRTRIVYTDRNDEN